MQRDIKIEDREKLSLSLINFARSGDLQGVRGLLDAGINVNYIHQTVHVQGKVYAGSGGSIDTSYRKETALAAAVANNHIDVAQLLLERKADASLCDPTYDLVGKYCEGRSNKSQNLAMLKLLLSYSPDLNQVQNGMNSALSRALAHEEIALLLIQHGADVNHHMFSNSSSRGSILHYAIGDGASPAVIQALVDKGANLKFISYKQLRDSEVCCLCFITTPCLWIPICYCLCCSDSGTGRGFTPLQYARYCNRSPEIIAILRNGRTPAVQLSASPALLAQGKQGREVKEQVAAPAALNMS